MKKSEPRSKLGSKGDTTTTDLLAGSRAALIIATANCADPSLAPLPGISGAASALAAVLTDQAVGRFAVTTMVDKTAAEIRIGIVEFLRTRASDEQILLSYSGHGLRDIFGRLYFTAADTVNDLLPANGIEARWLMERLVDCRATRQILIVDCCYSGGVADSAMGSSEHLLRDLPGAGRGRAILTASRPAELAFVETAKQGNDGKGSIFLNGFVEGLQTGLADAEPQDGYISVQEAYDYAYQYVVASGSPQRPQHWFEGAEGKIWLARNQSTDTVQAAPIPDALRVLIESPYANARLSSISELARWLISGDAARSLAAKQVLERMAAEDSPAVATAARVALSQTGQPQRPTMPRRPLKTLRGHRDWVRSVAFSSTGLLASAGDDKEIRLWRNDDSDTPPHLPGHRNWIRALAFSPNGDLLASAGDDATAIVWNLADTRERQVAVLQHERPVYTIAFSSDGRLISTAGKDFGVNLWDCDDLSRPIATRKAGGGTVWQLSFSPVENLLAIATDNGQLHLWDTASGGMSEIDAHDDGIFSVAFSHAGNLLASSSDDNTIRIWDTGNRERLHELPGHSRAVHCIAFSTDDSMLASGSDDGSVRLWDPRDGQHIHTFEGHAGPVRSVAFLPEGNLLASGGKDALVHLWDLSPELDD